MLTPDEPREILLARRKELLARVRRIEADFRREETPLEKDAEEQSIQIEDDEVLKALDAAGRQEIQSIDRALARMDAGEYGICVHCGEPIAPARLQALPAAERCIRCAEKADG